MLTYHALYGAARTSCCTTHCQDLCCNCTTILSQRAHRLGLQLCTGTADDDTTSAVNSLVLIANYGYTKQCCTLPRRKQVDKMSAVHVQMLAEYTECHRAMQECLTCAVCRVVAPSSAVSARLRERASAEWPSGVVHTCHAQYVIPAVHAINILLRKWDLQLLHLDRRAWRRPWAYVYTV